MRKEDVQTAFGLIVPVIVFAVLAILKCIHIIKWSWVWVTSPLWIVSLLIGFLSIIYVAVFAFRYRKSRNRSH